MTRTKYAIEIKGVQKAYRLYHERRPTLKERLLFRGTDRWTDLPALKDINLSVPQGATVGFIGQNGSGKSTLLKLMARIIYPDRGEVITHGKVSSLLELGAGFDPDFTGRENIYMNASIFGLSRREIDSRFDEIVRFSELAEFIDNPVRSYSSGMYMRLGFAVAINVDPDILLVDEVLAVGDISFQKKCVDRIQDLKRRGKTIVIVSHDASAIQRLCDHVAWLDQGRIVLEGEPVPVTEGYLGKMASRENEALTEQKQTELSRTDGAGRRWGNMHVVIDRVTMTDAEGKERYVFGCGDPANIRIEYEIKKKGSTPVFGIGIFRSDGLNCYSTNTLIDEVQMEVPDRGAVEIRIQSLPLIEGIYRLDVAAHDVYGLPFDYQTEVVTFKTGSRIRDIGVSRITHLWTIEPRDSGRELSV